MMPARQPFTSLCQQLARAPLAGRADLHLHTTASDGTYTPAQVIDLARRAGLAAVAITDHDTLAGLGAARAAAGASLEVIAGVEITTELHGREQHLLAYFVDPDDEPLGAALAAIRRGRAERFAEMLERLRDCGVSVEDDGRHAMPDAIGRRHLAELLVRQGHAGSVREAFSRWLADGKRACVPKKRPAIGEAIALVRRAGGVAAWAHPTYDGTRERLAELAGLGLGAVEVEFPEVRPARAAELRAWARALGLAVTGGSDCHGPGRRTVGSGTVSDEELEALRAQRGEGPCSAPCSTRSSKA
jgi:predicted metal-dependent phosphoesterase TrpH